jgi:predicted metal-binding membrane protein
MSSILTNQRSSPAATVQYFFWRHPEWWAWALCCLAWALMLLQGLQRAGHEVHESMTFAQELTAWMVMVTAMMLPLVIHRVWLTAVNSIWARRHRAIAGFLAGYFSSWLLLGTAAAALRQSGWTHTYIAAGLCFMAAALWQLTPTHRRGLTACHGIMPLAPLGWQADLDCLRFGGRIGVACIWSCWPLMLACAFAGHSLIATTGSMLASLSGRKWFRQRHRAMLAGTLMLAAYYLVAAGGEAGP